MSTIISFVTTSEYLKTKCIICVRVMGIQWNTITLDNAQQN